MQNQLTSIEKQKQKASMLKKCICKLLDWDELQYGYYMMNAGRNYLIYYTNNDEVIIGQMERSRLFWNWWKNHWLLRDEAFFFDNENQLQQLSLQNIQLLYQHTHDALLLSREIYPSGVVLGNSYANMIGTLIKKEVAI